MLTLAQAPRPVSVLLRAQVLLGGMFASLGWTFLGGGCLTLIVFGTILGFDTSMHQFWGTLDRVSGRVISTEQTLRDLVRQSRKGTTRHHTVRYEYTAADGQRRTGSSVVIVKDRDGLVFTVGTLEQVPSVGDEVQIEHPRGKPSLSRMVGGYHDGGGGSWIIALLSAIGVGTGLVMVIRSFFRGFKRMRLLSRGETAQARLINTRTARYGMMKRQVYELEFEFEALDGLPYRVKVTTNSPEQLEDEATEPVLFDPKHPDAAVVLDSLPSTVQIGADGSLGVANTKAGLRVFLVPALGLLALGAAILWWMVF